MRGLSIAILLIISLTSFSQDCFVKRKKSKKLIEKINSNLTHYSFSEVKEELMSIQKKEGESAQIFNMYALIYWLKEDFLKAKEFAEKTLSLCPENFSTSHYILGILSYKYRDYNQSVYHLNKSSQIGVIERFRTRASEVLNKASILDNIMKDTVPYSPQLVEGRSTEADEYLPLISPDQEMIFLTRRGVREELGVINKESEDFIVSQGDINSLDPGRAMEYPFNQNNNEGGATITIDNNILYFTICGKFGSNYNNCDIYYVERNQGGGWSDLISLQSINNPRSWESQPSISVDGSSLIFASDRKGGFGGIDLYIVKKDKFGHWGVPKNMGPIINSEFNEKSPFFHVDGETMYFSSEQFPSLGGYDIFMTKLQSNNNWAVPVNIGFPINTKDDELGMFVTTDGKTAYFCSNKLEGIGGWDLYSFSLYEDVQPKRVLFLKGDISDSNGIVDSVILRMQNISTNEVTEILINGGKYVSAFTIQKSDDILITFNKDGYAFNSHYISSVDENFSSPSEMDVEMIKVKENQTFQINNIYFDTDSFNLTAISRSILGSFADYLNKNTSIELLIAGHTDNIGSHESNLSLSTNRARSVYNFLIENGVGENRLKYVGYGEDNPIDNNDTVKGRSRNRRTECTVTNK